MATLKFDAQHDQPPREIQITGNCRLGRKTPIVVDYDFVSSVHCEIEIVNGIHFIADLNSTNCTFIGEGETPLIPERFYQIKHGQTIRLGRTSFKYLIADAELSAAEACPQQVDGELVADTKHKTGKENNKKRSLSMKGSVKKRAKSVDIVDDDQVLPHVHLTQQPLSQSISPSTSPSQVKSQKSQKSHKRKSKYDNLIMVTMTDLSKKQMDGLKQLNIGITEDAKECEVLITNKLIRNVKLVSSISRGIPIVTTEWIDECISSNNFVDCLGFELSDPQQEKKYGIKLKQVLSKQHNIFQGFKFVLTPSVRPEYSSLKQVIELGGGEVLSDITMPRRDDVLIIGCKEDIDLIKTYQDSGWSVYTSELVMASALRQDFDPSLYGFGKIK